MHVCVCVWTLRKRLSRCAVAISLPHDLPKYGHRVQTVVTTLILQPFYLYNVF